MMRHSPFAVLFSLFLALAALSGRGLSAQDLTRPAFRKAWAQGMSLEDDKLLDKAMKRGPLHAAQFSEELLICRKLMPFDKRLDRDVISGL